MNPTSGLSPPKAAVHIVLRLQNPPFPHWWILPHQSHRLTSNCETDMLNDIVNTSIKRNDKTFRLGLLLVGGGSPPEIWLPKAPQMQVHRVEIANCSLRNTNCNMQIWTMCPNFQCLLPSLSSPTFGLTLNVVDQQVDFSHTPFFSWKILLLYHFKYPIKEAWGSLV